MIGGKFSVSQDRLTLSRSIIPQSEGLKEERGDSEDHRIERTTNSEVVPSNQETETSNLPTKELFIDVDSNMIQKEGEVASPSTTKEQQQFPTKSYSKRFSSASTQHHEVPLIELKLENVTYAPIVSSANASAGNGEQRRVEVLSNVTTTIRPGKLTAWMGPSGSGKTSFLSVAAGLVHKDDLLDDTKILVNGAMGRIPKRLVGVVWQDDLLLSNLTVEENIFFAARMKTPESVSNEDVKQLVDETMAELGLSHVHNNLVGSPGGPVRGVSGGERKRVAVACELVVRPSLLLLDEPTSGLDATTAHSLVETLKDLATVGNHSIVVVIHQPRTTIYNMFDHLLLLSKGRVVFDGEPSKARAFLEACPTVTELPPETGIADWIMDVIIEDERRGKNGSGAKQQQQQQQTSNGDIAEEPLLPKYWEDHTAKDQMSRPTPRRLSSKLKDLKDLQSAPKYFVGFWTQLHWLMKRTVKQQRGERITTATTILQFMYLFFTSLFWWRMPDTTEYIFPRNSLLFFMLVAQANSIVVNSVAVFQRERTLLRRERSKKMYAVSSYFLAKTVSDMSTNVFLPYLYCLLVYWTAGYTMTAVAFFKFALAMYLTLSTAQSMGLWISIVIPNNQLSLILAPPITLFFIIMGGFYVPFNTMPSWISWLSWLSFARYGYSALVLNEFIGRDIPCSGSMSGNLTDYGHGAIASSSSDVDASTLLIGTGGGDHFCPLPGESVAVGLGLNGVAQNFWFNLGMLFGMQMLFRIAAYVALRRSK